MSKVLEFNTKNLTAKCNGDEFKVTYPSVDQLEKHFLSNDSKKKKTESESLKGTKDFLCELGLPLKVSGAMSAVDLKMLMEELTASSQKKA